MLTNFTWWQFFGFFLLLSAIYYPLILSVYFRKEVIVFWQKFIVPVRNNNNNNNASYGLVEDEELPQTESSVADQLSDATIIKLITSLTEDIRNGVKAAADSGASKDQLFGLLKNILAKYPQLKKSGHRVQINEFIIQEAVQHHYTIHMAQVYALWAQATDVNE